MQPIAVFILKKKEIQRVIAYFPIVGMMLYLIVFTVAASSYPGGSINQPHDNSYSMFHNFLCDVMNPITQGGKINDARPLAIISHLILSFTMISFFYILPKIFPQKNGNTKWMQVFGMITMTAFIFMYTQYHDQIVTITGILGTIALIPFFIEIFKHPNSKLRQLAYTCYILSVVVFFIFETKLGFYYLPFLQKITFVFDAWWVIWVSLVVIKKHQESVVLASSNG